MAEIRMEELAQQLLTQTKAGKVEWEKTRRPYADIDYRLFFPEGYFAIETISNGPRLSLYDDSGVTVDELESGASEKIATTLREIIDLAEARIKDRGIERAFEFLKNR